jgi:hypothetical protein
MPIIPPVLLKQIYRRGSLQNTATGFSLTLQNHLAPATLVGLDLTVDGAPLDPAALTVVEGMSGGAPTETQTPAQHITLAHPLHFPTGVPTRLDIRGAPLSPGPHTLAVRAVTQELGPVTIEISDTVT